MPDGWEGNWRKVMATYRRVYDMPVCRCGPGGCGPGGRWWQPTTGWLCMLSPAGWLPRVRDQLRLLTLDYEYGTPLPFYLTAASHR